MSAPGFPFLPTPETIEEGRWEPEEVEEILATAQTASLPDRPEITDLLQFLVGEEAWMAEGTCKVEKASWKLFVLDKGKNAHEARRYCRRCPVRQECLDYGLKTGSVGVWGGEVLGLANRDGIELSDMHIQDARPVHLEYLVNPPPLQPHQIPAVIFNNPTQGTT